MSTERSQIIDNIIDVIDSTINEFEILSKSGVSENSGGGQKLTEGGLKGTSAKSTELKDKKDDLQTSESTEKGLETSNVTIQDEYKTRNYKKEGVNGQAFAKAEEEDEDEDKKKKKDEEKVEKKEDKEDKEDKDLKKSYEIENEELKKSLNSMKEEIASLSVQVKELSNAPVEAKGRMFNNVKPLHKSSEYEALTKSQIANKLLDLYKSGDKDITTEEIAKVELGTDEAAQEMAAKYLY
jgi:hypothetical protein